MDGRCAPDRSAQGERGGKGEPYGTIPRLSGGGVEPWTPEGWAALRFAEDRTKS
jgi:hypothetical protein